jgi:hypothetical protein
MLTATAASNPSHGVNLSKITSSTRQDARVYPDNPDKKTPNRASGSVGPQQQTATSWNYPKVPAATVANGLSSRNAEKSYLVSRRTLTATVEETAAARTHPSSSANVDGDLVDSRIEDCRRLLDGLDQVKCDRLLGEFEQIENEICSVADRLKRLIDGHRGKLIDELASVKRRFVKDLETSKDQLEMQLCELESLRRHRPTEKSRELPATMRSGADERVRWRIHEGTEGSRGGAKNGGGGEWQRVLSRVDEVLRSVRSTLATDRRRIDFRSATCDWLRNATTDDVIGTVVVVGVDDVTVEGPDCSSVAPSASPHQPSSTGSPPRAAESADHVTVHVIPKADGVWLGAVTSLDDELFVVRVKSHGVVHVYDATSLTPRRHLVVPGLGPQAWGLVACRLNRCLYVSDHVSNCIHRIELRRRDAVEKQQQRVNNDSNNKNVESATSRWTVARRPVGLSIDESADSNVIVVCQSSPPIIQEFTTRGAIVHQVELPVSVIDSPWQAVRLPDTGQFVVSHGGSTAAPAVHVVSPDGRILAGYWAGRIEPRGLVLTRDASLRVLVADKKSNRVLILDPRSSSTDPAPSRHLRLPAAVDGGLEGPQGLFLDWSRDRLYVAEWNGCRLLTFDNVAELLD